MRFPAFSFEQARPFNDENVFDVVHVSLIEAALHSENSLTEEA